MTLDAALAQRRPRVAAWDGGDLGNVLSIVAVERNDAKVIARESVPLPERSAVERRLAQHGIPIGATHRGCDFVWVCDDEHLTVVQLDAGITLEALGADLVIAGRRVEIREVAAILSFVDRDDIGHRGVRVVLINGDAVTFAEEHDPTPAVDPAYGRMNLELDAGWIVMLGRDLAARLVVVHRDELWDREIQPPAAKQPGDAATDAFVEGLIDAYQHWDDPDRVAQREARDAAVRKRDEAILELAYIESGQRGDAPMDVAVAKMAVHFAGRIEREVPDAGTFTAIHQPLPEIENGGYVALEIEPVEGSGRVLELRVESASGEHTASEVLRTGSTAGLVRYLRAAAFPDQVVPLIEQLTEATREGGSGNLPPAITEPRARTSREMSFYASLQSCPQCGMRVDPEPLRIYGSGTAWSLAGKCTSCQHNLAYTFITIDEDPIQAPADFHELGSGHSEIIAPRLFIAEIARIEPTLVTDPTHLGLEDWRRHRDGSNRIDVCLNELAKFFPAGAAAIPEELLSAEDRADREANPERYTRAWLDRASEYRQRVSAGIIADLPRYDRLDEAARVKRRRKGIDWIEREALQAHERWVERGKKGKGRLVVVGAHHEEMKIGRGVELTGARFSDTELPDVYLVDARLHDAELVETRLVRGKLYGAELVGASLKGGSLASADLETADLTRTTIEGTDFSGAELHLSAWDGADVSNASFARAEFGDAKLDGAVFRGCDFRDAVFSADDPDDPPTTRARFERCDLRDSRWHARDLRGAVFIDCKLAGITGTPASIESVTIENADLTESEIREAWGTIT
jgi:uncharacterized protein YjbI with pentapeptide repeats